MSTQDQQLAYIERYLIYDVFKYFGSEAALLSHRIECSNGLDGFMSALYTVELDMKISGNDKKETVLVKFMKGSKDFRESSKSYTQFANEIFVYSKLLPAYENLLRSSHLNTDVIDELVPRVYRAEFGIVNGLSNDRESVLVLQHLKPAGYALGPRLTLRSDQLEAMCAMLGPFHALGYATRLLQPQVHERLRASHITFPFVTEPGISNLYAVLFRVAFDRFYEFYDRCRDQLIQPQDADFAAAIERMRERYFAEPWLLLEHIRTSSCDETQPNNQFSTFLHGDFNRNNVLFHENEQGKVDGIRMIDFQEHRYSTVAIDISFFLYMNAPITELKTIFPRLLRHYHKHMLQMLELVMQRNHHDFTEQQLEQLLTDYSFDKFEAHFTRYAFHGVMICMHFMPWLLGSETECEQLSKLFETDMHGQAFHRLSMDIAGDVANQHIFQVVRHAFEQGSMDWI